MIKMTQAAINKVLSLLESQGTPTSGLRASVVGGGCSGFSYSLAFENETGPFDKTYEFEGVNLNGEYKKLKVMVDQASLLYLNDCEIDYVEGLEGNGFKFNNPNTKSTCGCGSSFSA
jgi:iron-sulfur cluster assembly protein